MFGRQRWSGAVRSRIERIRSKAEREIINMPIQGGAQGIMKLAMADLYTETVAKGSRVLSLLQIHDELLFEVDEDIAEECCKQFKGTMEQVLERGGDKFSVPLVADAKFGDNWEEAH